MYVYFDLSAVDSGGRNVITRLFAQVIISVPIIMCRRLDTKRISNHFPNQAPLTSLSVSRSCESLQATLDLLSTSSVDLSIGLVGSSPEWDTSVYQYNNVRQVSVAGGILDVTNNTARSLESGLITLVVRGDPNVFSSSLTNSYFLEIEHLTTIHFLDATKFSTIKAMIAAGTGYSVIKDTTAGVLSIQLSQALSSACSAGGN